MATNELGTLLPNGFQTETWSKQESANSHIKDGTASQTADKLDFTVPKTGIIYAGKHYEVVTRFGTFSGIATTDNDTRNLFKGLNIEKSGMQGYLSKFNLVRSIPPFYGSFHDYLEMLKELVQYDGRLVMFWDIYAPPIMTQGTYGNVLEEMIKVATMLGAEIRENARYVYVRPIKKYWLNDDIFKDGFPQVTYTKSNVKPFIKVNYYKQQWGNLCQYPMKKQDDRENKGNVYLAPLSPSSQNTLSVNNQGIGDGSDYTEQVFDILGSLKTVNQPICSLPPAFRFNDIIYCYLEGWANVGQVRYTVAQPTEFTTNSTLKHATGGQFAYCTSNQVFYYCTVGYEAAHDSVPELFAQWYQYASFNGDQLTTSEQLKEYLEQYKSMDNTQGWYTVIDNKGVSIMPEEWTNNGGKLQVSIEKETNKLKVQLWGADISLNIPIYAVSPNENNLPGADGDMVGFDVNGRKTLDTMLFIYDSTKPAGQKWAYQDSASNSIFPRQPYKIAVSSFSKEYNGLYITGEGIRYEVDNYIAKSSNLGTIEDDLSPEDNTLTIDNRYITNMELARAVSREVDAYSNGVTYTFSGTIKHLTDSAIIKAKKGTFDWVTDFLIENIDDRDVITFDDVTDFFVSKGLGTFDEITNWLMKQDSLHLSDTEFGNVAGAMIHITNRSYFRITEATIDPSGISISGYALMTLGDWDRAIALKNKHLTLGDWGDAIQQIQDRERQSDYVLGMWEQELLRLTL